MKRTTHPIIDARRTLLKIVLAHVGSTAFRSLYMKHGRRSVDICRNGELSCAFFVSAVLRNVNLLADQHATVSGTIRDLRASGWKQIETPRPGAVIVWSPITYRDGESHAHIGIAVSHTTAVSTSVRTKTPVRHAIGRAANGHGTRTIASIWWHPDLT